MDIAERKKRRRTLRLLCCGAGFVIGFYAVLLLVIFYWHLSLFFVSGTSMQPALQDGELIVLQDKESLSHGDIVVFSRQQAWAQYSDSNKPLIKRVVAVPGDRLTFADGVFRVNGQTVYDTRKENYTCASGKPLDYVLNNNEMLVFGDNSHHSLDSRRVFCDGHPDFLVKTDDVIGQGEVWLHFGS